MSQIKTTKMNRILPLLALSLFCLSTFSCAKKASGVRGSVKKTESISMNQPVSTQAEQQAAAQNSLYKIATISTPAPTDNGVSVDFEILTPLNQYLPVTTKFENGNLNSSGTYQDPTRGNQVRMDSRCSADGCSKYLLLVQVIRNGATIFQTAAVSYKTDCSFYTISVTNSFSTIDALDSYVQRNSAFSAPRNDCVGNVDM